MKITERRTRSTDNTQIDDVLTYQGEIIPLLDVTYTEYSEDELTWHKEYTVADLWIRTSNDNKATWVTTAFVVSVDSNTYTDTPATQTVGGIKAGDEFVDKTNQELWHDLTHAFLLPVLFDFTSNQSPLVEVGTVITGTKEFMWDMTNYENIELVSGIIKDGITPILTDIEASDGWVSLVLTIANNVPVSKSYTIEALSTEPSVILPSNPFTIQSVYPIFKGTFSSASLTVARPSAGDIDITANINRMVAISTGDVTLAINSLTDDYVWVAIPTTSDAFSKWIIDTDDKGEMGSGCLFPTPESANLTSPNGFWTDIPYRIYISNYPTSVSNITLTR